MSKHQYFVMTPVDEGYSDTLSLDPPEPSREVVEVTASNKREAKRLAYHLLKDKGDWLNEARGDNVNPFTRLTVEVFEDEI